MGVGDTTRDAARIRVRLARTRHTSGVNASCRRDENENKNATKSATASTDVTGQWTHACDDNVRMLIYDVHARTPERTQFANAGRGRGSDPSDDRTLTRTAEGCRWKTPFVATHGSVHCARSRRGLQHSSWRAAGLALCHHGILAMMTHWWVPVGTHWCLLRRRRCGSPNQQQELPRRLHSSTESKAVIEEKVIQKSDCRK